MLGLACFCVLCFSKKTWHFTFVYIFASYWQIFKILSLARSADSATFLLAHPCAFGRPQNDLLCRVWLQTLTTLTVTAKITITVFKHHHCRRTLLTVKACPCSEWSNWTPNWTCWFGLDLGSAMVLSDRALATSYRLSIVTMSPISSYKWPYIRNGER